MTRAAIGPTVTHKVRAFLLQHGVALAPWSGLDQTYRSLYVLLNQRKEDPAFWGPVAELLRTIVRCATEPGAARLTTSHAELLSAWEIDELVRDLRAALPGGEQGGQNGALRAFAQRLSAPVLGGFLLLGLVASGCGSSVTVEGAPGPEPDAGSDAATISDASDDAPSDAPALPPWAENCDLYPESVLFQTIDAANLSDWSKGDLCQCFSELNASWNDGLTELFQTGTAEQIAAALEEMLECCSYGMMPLADFDAVVDQLLDGSLCEIPMPYAGVSFPEE